MDAISEFFQPLLAKLSEIGAFFASIFPFIQQNVEYAPFIVFGLLLLAGFNIPVSEDAMIFISALLAAKNPSYIIPLFFGVYLGAYFSDLICYWLGRTLGPRIFQIKFFARLIDREKIDKVTAYYEKYGATTLVLGRFIPFGVRNALFLTAGLGKMNFAKFALFDFIACTISVSLLFTLVYNFGEIVMDYVKRGNMVIFAIAAVAVVALLIRKRIKDKQGRDITEDRDSGPFVEP